MTTRDFDAALCPACQGFDDHDHDDGGASHALGHPHHGRRRLLRSLALAPVALGLPMAPSAWAAAPRSLSFYHTHTGERLELEYFRAGNYLPQALDALDKLLRDFRTDDMVEMDRQLFDLLHGVSQAVGGGTIEIVSGYRSPRTNAMLRANSNGVARKSLHMQGRAIDVRLRGRDTRKVRDAAIALAAGGVGYYAKSDFVHLDTGRVRRW